MSHRHAREKMYMELKQLRKKEGQYTQSLLQPIQPLYDCYSDNPLAFFDGLTDFFMSCML